MSEFVDVMKDEWQHGRLLSRAILIIATPLLFIGFLISKLLRVE